MFLRQKCQHVTVTIVLALSTLGDAPQIEMILCIVCCCCWHFSLSYIYIGEAYKVAFTLWQKLL